MLARTRLHGPVQYPWWLITLVHVTKVIYQSFRDLVCQTGRADTARYAGSRERKQVLLRVTK
jgi:hypothetical protein